MNMNDARMIKECVSERNQVIFIGEKTIHSIESNDEKREELLKVDKYVEYGSNSYRGEPGAITIYTIKERILDENNNLLLISEMEYVK
jgi:hypothetical protein